MFKYRIQNLSEVILLARTLTFRGGIHVDENKNTRKYQTQKMPAPQKICISMHQHIGAPCEPSVSVGDAVDAWQPVGEIKSGLGCPVHTCVSGKVLKIEERYNTSGAKVRHIIIENDGQGRMWSGISPHSKKLTDTSTEEIIEIVRAAGIVGLGGAAFPTYAKISSSIGKVKTLIVNSAECEPYISANNRLMLEHPDYIINGLKILLRALGLRQGIIAVEDNKPDAINKLENLLAGSELVEVKTLKTKYPQGDERQLVYAITGRELPMGKLPADLGCVIFNAETCSAIFNAFAKGKPLVERIVTVDGDCVRDPKNVLVPMGSTYRDIIEFCGGFKKRPYKIINGGPMMGSAIWDIDSPLPKGSSSIIALSSESSKMYTKPYACIRCGKCAECCPMSLMPLYLSAFSEAYNFERCRELDVMSCVECGCCVYNCPGNVPIVQHIRAAKAVVSDTVKKEDSARAKAEAEAKKAAEKKAAEAAAREEEQLRLIRERRESAAPDNSNNISGSGSDSDNANDKREEGDADGTAGKQ